MKRIYLLVTVLFCISFSLLAQESQVFKCGNAKFKMIFVQGGTFTMGDDSGPKIEKPAHEVTLSDYYIGETEVTQQLWTAVMGKNPSAYKGDKHPVECISWNDAQVFIKKLNEVTGMEFRLPTEAEWEFAAKGGNMGQHYRYSGSNDIEKIAWCTLASLDPGKGFYPNSTASVKKKKPNELGVYDMTGNVWELCQDVISTYPSDKQTNPVVETNPDNNQRIVRGGSFESAYDNTGRKSVSPNTYFGQLGFRLALTKPAN